MPALADSDPLKWKYDLHTRIKHEILVGYLDAWTTVLGNSPAGLAYVDAFAGRGRYEGGEPGSPLLVIRTMLDAMSSRRITASRVSFHFVEQDPKNALNLEQELKDYVPAHDPRVEYRLYPNAFASVSDNIVADIRQRGQPSFFFVDPFGYDDAPLEILQRILRLPRAEVFINLMYDFASRAVGVSGNPALALTLDGLFGTNAWRGVAGLTGQAREKRFVAIYGARLKEAGAAHVLPFRMGDDARERTLYYLLHATKHVKGLSIMKDMMVDSSSPGNFGYAGEQRHQMLPLFDFDVADLPSFLQRTLGGQIFTFDAIIESTLEETGTCRERDYRSCLKDMERRGQITVERVTSKSRQGLSGNDRISFPATSPATQGGFTFGDT